MVPFQSAYVILHIIYNYHWFIVNYEKNIDINGKVYL